MEGSLNDVDNITPLACFCRLLTYTGHQGMGFSLKLTSENSHTSEGSLRAAFLLFCHPAGFHHPACHSLHIQGLAPVASARPVRMICLLLIRLHPFAHIRSDRRKRKKAFHQELCHRCARRAPPKRWRDRTIERCRSYHACGLAFSGSFRTLDIREWGFR